MSNVEPFNFRSNQGQQNVGKSFQNILKKRPKMQSEYEKIRKIILDDEEIQKFIQNNQPALNETIFNRDLATVYEYYLQRQKQNAGQNDVHPGYNPELLFVDQRVVIQYRASKQMQKQHEKLKASSKITTLGMPKQLKMATMNDFTGIEPGMAAAVLAVSEFIQAYVENPKEFHRATYLQGPYGVGKTYLMGAMANQLSFDDIDVLLLHYPTLASNMKEAINDSSIDTKTVRLEMKNVDILVLDDIGAEIDGSGWIRDDVLSVVLDYRMQNGLATFFTSNFSMNQLEKEHFALTKNGADPVKAERIMQRIKYLAKEIPVSGKNRRLDS
ncbi:primosomal protein DnaI [Weissella coleopterorum]|uniref:Primosomal protein DnaI n=1 Tax=Weissella coleopterorum TaxID=2714949 RepID=A0A6G8B045_9LACO|nr:primosomal protein DnaI [Weissella coleopterorum]QIL50589.1 primosomal protein DnaI [Weissella coleopterorum]